MSLKDYGSRLLIMLVVLLVAAVIASGINWLETTVEYSFGQMLLNDLFVTFRVGLGPFFLASITHTALLGYQIRRQERKAGVWSVGAGAILGILAGALMNFLMSHRVSIGSWKLLWVAGAVGLVYGALAPIPISEMIARSGSDGGTIGHRV